MLLNAEVATDVVCSGKSTPPSQLVTPGGMFTGPKPDEAFECFSFQTAIVRRSGTCMLYRNGLKQNQTAKRLSSRAVGCRLF